jgi:hypothetical protein
MKILKKAIKLSYDRFNPNPFQRRYHFTIAFDGNKPLLIAQNNPLKINHKAYLIGKKFNINTYQEFPYVHSESHLISKLLDRYNSIDTDLSIVNVRINRQGIVLLSKPCKNCQKILDAVGLNKIYWTVSGNKFADRYNNEWHIRDILRSNFLKISS